MPTFIEALPPRLSSKHSGIRWTPSEQTPGGLIAIHTDRSQAEYILIPFGADGGQGFHLAKVTAGTDAESESYDVFCSSAHPAYDTCDCKGFTYKRTCKHVDAARALIDNRWI